MSLTSRIVSGSFPVPSQFTFPGIFKGKTGGTLWLAQSRDRAVRITPGDRPWMKVGDSLATISDPRGYGVCPGRFEQIDSPVTVTFFPTT